MAELAEASSFVVAVLQQSAGLEAADNTAAYKQRFCSKAKLGSSLKLKLMCVSTDSGWESKV